MTGRCEAPLNRVHVGSGKEQRPPPGSETECIVTRALLHWGNTALMRQVAWSLYQPNETLFVRTTSRNWRKEPTFDPGAFIRSSPGSVRRPNNVP
ncbi:hypothetical protein RSOLAG1IB_01366 [Rhizoctonia solani AG-1 IB]|uniref:Uncharacterized protein n=1 Tax=Thanatephorus cucumeris (strain AG1-IB / isolate 7/3/14) TaxID=1108050 RepID=A0A0B7FBD0_THACB|nr:hypothetical protein RSOLAG1IB_01366 [Rhizoctonia solani AG-1 IB]